MNFKFWIESETGLTTGNLETFPNPVNRSGDTPASDEVKRTGLQPQVDAQSTKTKANKEQDAMLAIDSEIEHMTNNLPADDEGTPKVNKFKELWDQLRQTWEKVKMSEEKPEDDKGEGLGNAKDDKFTQMMQQFPNMKPMSPESQGLGGPGVFGLS